MPMVAAIRGGPFAVSIGILKEKATGGGTGKEIERRWKKALR